MSTEDLIRRLYLDGTSTAREAAEYIAAKPSEAETKRVETIISHYRSTVSNSPELLSLLYDADLLPEQIITVRGALSMAAVVEAYKLGKNKND